MLTVEQVCYSASNSSLINYNSTNVSWSTGSTINIGEITGITSDGTSTIGAWNGYWNGDTIITPYVQPPFYPEQPFVTTPIIIPQQIIVQPLVIQPPIPDGHEMLLVPKDKAGKRRALRKALEGIDPKPRKVSKRPLRHIVVG